MNTRDRFPVAAVPVFLVSFVACIAAPPASIDAADGDVVSEDELVQARVKAKPVTLARAESFRVRSRAIGDTFEIKVALPSSYDQDDTRRYPVIYATDGDLQLEFLTGVLRYMELALVFGAPFPEHIVVTVGYGTDDALAVAEKRARDLTPTAMVPPPFPWEKSTGQAAAFFAFLQGSIIPAIEQRYRALSTDRIYFGHSYGGLFGAFVLFSRPETFSRYILSSPALWWDNGVIFQLEQAYAANHGALPATVAWSAGALEDVNAILTPLRTMTTVVQNYTGLRSSTSELAGDDHLSVPANAFSKGFRFVMSAP